MIEAESLTRRFGARVAVDAVTLRVPAGALLALLGPNGAGKTTTVRMLAGLLRPTSGQAVVAGHGVLAEPSAVRARVGLVTDVPGLYPRMTPPEYLHFFGRLYGLHGPALRRRIDELLAFFELTGHRRERLGGFSKGMQQKVALARALLHQPPVLFLDEPTAGLDPLAARAVRALIVELKQANRAIVLCTHDLDEAERLADQVAIMRQGRLVASDTPGALRASADKMVRVRVELAAPGPAVVPLLDGLAGVMTPRLVPATNGGSAMLEYHTAEPRSVNPLVVARLVAAGAGVVAMGWEARPLEDVYAVAVGGGGEPAAQQGGDGR
jgi:ABC-2 type transport system ATP-binding protein